MIEYTMPVVPPLRKTASEWTTYNKPLAEGQIGIVKDTGQLFVGDGVKTYPNIAKIEHVDPVDSLNSFETTIPLSANQGRKLAKEHRSYTIYVDRNTGEDLTDRLNNGQAVKTLEFALQYAPQNGDLTISFTTSGTYTLSRPYIIYNDTFTIEGAASGTTSINISANILSNKSFDNKNATSVFTYKGRGNSTFKGITFTSSGNTPNLINTDYSFNTVSLINCILNSLGACLDIINANAIINGCTFNNCTYIAKNTNGNIRYSNSACTSAEGSYGFSCDNGIIKVDNAPVTHNGNVVTNNGKIIGQTTIWHIRPNNTSYGLGVGTSDNPINGISSAIKCMPTHCEGIFTLYLSNSEIYGESNVLDLSNKCLGGTLKIMGYSTSSKSKIRFSTANIVGINIDNTLDTKTNIIIEGIQLYTTSSNILFSKGINISNAASVYIKNVELRSIESDGISIDLGNIMSIAKIANINIVPSSDSYNNPINITNGNLCYIDKITKSSSTINSNNILSINNSLVFSSTQTQANTSNNGVLCSYSVTQGDY